MQGTYPYFKTQYSALFLTSTNNTPGQHVQNVQEQNCYGVGDCLGGSQIVVSPPAGFATTPMKARTPATSDL